MAPLALEKCEFPLGAATAGRRPAEPDNKERQS